MATINMLEETANYLLNHCFVLGSVEDQRAKYLYVQDHLPEVRAVFKPLGYAVLLYPAPLQAAALVNEHEGSQARLLKYESILLLVLRLLYLQKRESLAASADQVLVTVEEVQTELQKMNLPRRLDQQTLERLMRTLRRYNLARPVGRLSGLDSRIEVFPTVLLALPDADLADAAAESARTRTELGLYERPEGRRHRSRGGRSMIELKRLKLINWHNFENVTFDCARLTYMIGVNAVGKTTILDAIRYCLTTNRNFNALGNKKSGRTLQGSVHAKQRGENAYRRPGHTVAYIGAEFYDSLKRAPFVIAVRVESEGPMQELHPGDQTWYLSEDGCTLEQLPFIDPRTGAPSAKEDFKPAVGRLSYTRSPSEARDRICRALGIGRASSPLGKKFNEVFQMGTSMDEIPNFREFLYQYILPQPELDLEALQGDRLELENLHAVLAEAQTRADALEEIVNYGREAAGKQTEALVNRGAALLARAAADGGEQDVWQGHLDAGHRQLEALNARYAEAKNAEAEARRAYLAAHSAAGASGEGRALDAMEEELSRRKTAQDAAARKAAQAEDAASKAEALLTALRRSGFASGWKLENLTADTLPQLTDWLAAQEKPLEEAYFAARQNTAALRKEQADKRAELDAVSGGKWVYPHGDAATRVRDAVNAELKSRGMQPDAKIFCELLAVADESWQDCVEACLGDRRFDILVPPAHYEAAKSAFVALKDKVGPISLLDTPGIRKANRHAETAPADSLAAQVTSENPLAAQYADTILRRIVCCDTPETLEQYPDSATRDLLRHHPFRLERLRTPQRYIGLEARRARAGALAEELEALAERTRTAAQTEQNLKTAYDQYQNFQRGTAPQQLADLWEARTAAEKARNAVAEQEGKLAEYRENPLLQEMYREEETREAAWEAARTAVEQVGGDIRVCEKQIASCEAEQKKAGETAQQSADAARKFFAAHPLLEPLARTRMQALAPADKPAAAAQAAEKAQARLDDALTAYLTGTLEPAQKAYNEHYVCDYPLGLAGLDQYRAQHESLVRIDLERYAARLEQAQRDCKDRFRKDILFHMKDDIFNARRQFRELNKVMEQLTYGEEVYRFELEPSRDPQLAAFYQVIVDKGNQQMTEGDSLDNLAATADPAYERQVDAADGKDHGGCGREHPCPAGGPHRHHHPVGLCGLPHLSGLRHQGHQPGHRPAGVPVPRQPRLLRRRESGTLLCGHLRIPAADLPEEREQHPSSAAGRGFQQDDQRPHPPHDGAVPPPAAAGAAHLHRGKEHRHPALLRHHLFHRAPWRRQRHCALCPPVGGMRCTPE